MTSLEELTIEGCFGLNNLPASIGDLPRIHLCFIKDCHNIKRLPDNFCKLANLQSLDIRHSGINALPMAFGELTKIRSLKLYDLHLKELPFSVGSLASLEDLVLHCMDLEELPASFGMLTQLKTIHLCSDALRDLPMSFESLISLRKLSSQDYGTGEAYRDRVFKTLASVLPCLFSLRLLYLPSQLDVDNTLVIGRSLKAWFPPLLECTGLNYINAPTTTGLQICWQTLGLPPEAATWHDCIILKYFAVQQQKVAAFASGLHARLGTGSQVSLLNAVALVLIADEVLGSWSLIQAWQRERLQREGEVGSASFRC